MASGSKATFVEIVIDRLRSWSHGACHLSLKMHCLLCLALRHVSTVNTDLVYCTVQHLSGLLHMFAYLFLDISKVFLRSTCFISYFPFSFLKLILSNGVLGGTVGWGTVLQAGKLRVRFPIGSLGLGSTQPLTEISTKLPPGVEGGDKGDWCVGLTALPSLCADCLEILEASTSWSPKVLPRPV